MKQSDPAEEVKACILLIKAAWKLGRKFNVCPVCVLYSVAESASDMVEDGKLQHGIPGTDYQCNEVGVPVERFH